MGGTGGMGDCLPFGPAAPNQNEDLAGIDGYEPVTGLFPRVEPCVRPVWVVENEKAEMELRRDPAFDVIQELPSLRASMSSVAKDGLGCFSSTTGGQGSRASLAALRLRRIVMSVPMRQVNAAVQRTATADE